MNKKKKIVYFHLSKEELELHITELFGFFENFIMKGTYTFCERLRNSDFFCITEIKEVQQIFEKAKIPKKNNKKLKTHLSLRDVVVILMLNNMYQKAYFSDGGDDMDATLTNAISGIDGVELEGVRGFMLKLAKNLEEQMSEAAINVLGFKEAMQPIYDFEV